MLSSPSPPATSSSATINLAELLVLIRQYRTRLLLATAIGSALGIAYALVYTPRWEASQALIVRNEAYNNLEGPGKFRNPDDMKVIQETVLELAKSHTVLARALCQVGPPAGAASSPWPTDRAIDALRRHIKLSPPKGAEFGKTEVFYLKVSDQNRQRAVKLATAICDALQSRFQAVLTEQAQSMVNELVDSVAATKSRLEQATARLAKMESEAGSDLAELRILQSSPSGASDLRQKSVFIEDEIRRLRTRERTNQELLKLLEAARQDPKHLIAAPNSLLESQPALRRLKEGLIDAQIKTSQLQGNMTTAHPQVIAALTAEQEIRRDIHNELELAIRGVQADSRLLAGQIQTLQEQLGQVNERLKTIALLRPQYANLVAEVEHATKLLQTAEANLADARAKETGALHASLISLIDLPDTGTRPVGPGKLIIVLAGTCGGFLTSLGLIALSVTAPLRQTQPVETPKTVGPAAPPGQRDAEKQKPRRSPTPAATPSRRKLPAAAPMSLKEALRRVAETVESSS